MAIAVGTTSSSSVTNAASLTWSHTVSSGSDLALVVAGQIGENIGSGDDDITTVVWNGASLTRVTGSESRDSNFLTTEWWYLLNPTPATGNVVITCVGSNQIIGGEATNLTGVHQTVTFGTAAIATATSTTPTVAVTAASGEVTIVSVASDADVALTARTGTLLAEINAIASDMCVGSQYYTTVNPTTQWSQASFPWAISGVAVKPSAGGTPTPSGKIYTKSLRPAIFSPGLAR